MRLRRAPVPQQAASAFLHTDPETLHKKISFLFQTRSYPCSKMPFWSLFQNKFKKKNKNQCNSHWKSQSHWPRRWNPRCRARALHSPVSQHPATGNITTTLIQTKASSASANMQQFCLSPFNNLMYTLIQKYLARKTNKERKSNLLGIFWYSYFFFFLEMFYLYKSKELQWI